MKILVMSGPNLNMLGVREKGVYGSNTLDEIHAAVAEKHADVELEFYQSNHEGDLIDKLHKSDADGIAFNAGAYTHYSIALRDAIAAIAPKPVVELHVSNVFKREDFRHVSVIAPVCAGSICGFGANSYVLAVSALKEILK